METNRRNIEFVTLDGVALRGWFYPVGQNSPAIILSHGLACLKEWYLDALAECFQAAGIAALVYDHRNFGASDGTPRHEINPDAQASDLHDAVSFIFSLPENIDSSKLAVFGYSMSAAHAIKAASIDRRIKAVIALHSFISGESLLTWTVPDREASDKLIWEDRVLRQGGQEPGYFPIIQTPETPNNAFLPMPDATEFFTRMQKTVSPEWENKATIQSLPWIRGYQMETYLKTMTPTPWLMLADEVSIGAYNPVFEMGVGPKEFKVISGGHFDAFGEEARKKVMDTSLDFLKRKLDL